MSDQRVEVTIDAAGVAEVALARPEKMNALDIPMFDALAAAIDRLGGDARLRAVVLHGHGRAFCAGLDIAVFGRISQGAPDARMQNLALRTDGISNWAQKVVWGWRELPVPVIAAVHGVAFGGGLQIALGADLRFVSADLKMSVMEIKWGLVPDMAGCVLLSQLTRPDVARELTFSGRIVEGTEARAIGLATRVCESPLEEARAFARQVAANSPDAIRGAKRLFNAASDLRSDELLLRESIEEQGLIGSRNQLEAVQAALEKRAPVFR